MLIGIDHLVILVRNLEKAVDTYRDLGFQVLQGGQHPYGTHNALVTFQDGSYLELIAFMEPEKPHDHRWYRFLDRPGLVDFAIGTDDLEIELGRVRGAGVSYEGPKPGARKRPDGQQLEWRTAPPPDDRAGELPFLIDDISERTLRVPGGDAAEHANGVTGIQSLVVAVRDLDEATEEYEALLARQAFRDTHEELGADIARLRCGTHEIILAYPTTPSSPLVEQIRSRGDGPFQVTLVAKDKIITSEWDPAKTEGVRFVVV
jgi:catechol 2,3-dioxygenase-like lactoylglutathione lyase family enzyme